MTRETPRGDYEVGHGKPPVSGQIKPGERRNPNGRPKGSASVSSIDKGLDQKVTLTTNGKRRKVDVTEALVTQMLNDALNGDRTARRDMLKIIHQRDMARRKASAPSERGEEAPVRGPPTIVFTTYIGNALKELGICVEINGAQLIPSWVFQAALARLEPEQRAQIDLSKLVHQLEDPAVLDEISAG